MANLDVEDDEDGDTAIGAKADVETPARPFSRACYSAFADHSCLKLRTDVAVEEDVEAEVSKPAGSTRTPPTWSVVFRAAWSWDLLAISVVYFVEGIMDMNLLAIAYFLKDTVGLGPAAAGISQAAASLPWEVTPLLGLLTDSVSIFGYRRKAYLVLVGLVGCCCWLLLPACTHVVAAVVVIGAANVCTAWSQVIADAVMVRMSQGREQDVASFYQALSWSSYTCGAVLSAVVGGLLMEARGPLVVFKLGAAGLLLDALCALMIQEPRQQPQQQQQQQQQRRGGGPKRPGGQCVSPAASGQLPSRGATPAGSPAGWGSGSGDGSPTAAAAGKAARGAAVARSRQLLVSTLERAWQQQQQEQQQEGQGKGSLSYDDLTDPLLPEVPISPNSGPGSGSGSGRRCPPGSRPQRSCCSCSWLSTLRLVFKTISGPEILVPALFIFLWQASPSAYNAMFYFQTDVLGFSADFLELVQLLGYLSGFAGLALYQLFLVNKPMGSMLLGCSLLGTALNATQLLLVTRLNLRMHIPDKLFVLGDYTMMSVFSEVMMTPLMAVAARHCPEGAEATMYATMYMILNWSSALATTLGAGLTRAFGVSDNFDGMPWLVLTCNLCMLLPLPILCFMPGEAQPALPQGSPILCLARRASIPEGATGAAAAAASPATITTVLSVRRLVLTPSVSLAQLALPDEEEGGGGGSLCSEGSDGEGQALLVEEAALQLEQEQEQGLVSGPASEP